MIFRWCFDVLTEKSISHLLIWHRLPNTPHDPPAPSDHRIPSQTSSTSRRQNIEVKNGRQVHLSWNFLQLTHPHLSDTCSTWRHLSTCPRATKHASRPTDPLEYIVDEGETKYQGEMWVQSLLFILFLVDSPFHHLTYTFCTRRHHPHAPRASILTLARSID